MKITQLFIFCLLLTSNRLLAQNMQQLTLEQCYHSASTSSPLAQQKALTITAGTLAEKNQSLKWLPEINSTVRRPISRK